MPIRAQILLEKEMPKEIAIYKPDIIPQDQYLVTWENNGNKTVKALKLDQLVALLGPKETVFENAEAEKQAFVKWLTE